LHCCSLIQIEDLRCNQGGPAYRGLVQLVIEGLIFGSGKVPVANNWAANSVSGGQRCSNEVIAKLGL
jgi:hypothetical protein